MKAFKKIIALILTIGILTTVFSACGKGQDSENDEGGGNTTVSDVPGGGVKINMSITEEVSNIDPNMAFSQSSMQMISLTNEGLMTFDTNGKVTCGLAESYDVSADGKTYTFHLRDDAYWSNGTKVTSNDFMFSWQRLANPETGSVYSYMLGTLGVKNGFTVPAGQADISELGISAPDESTFVVELDGPRTYFLYLIAMASYFMPINEEYFNECGDQFGKDIDHYISCGPFVFSDWEVGGTSYTLVKNEDYFAADTVTCDEVTFQIITDTAQMMMGWENKTLDYIALTGDYMEMYRDDPALNISDMAAMYFLEFNMQNEYLSNENLRMALSLAVDKEFIVDGMLNNGSRVADYLLPESFAEGSDGVFFRDKIGNPMYNSCDKEKALELWETAKSELGVDNITFELLYDVSTVTEEMCAFLKSEWEETLPGITIELSQTTYNNRLELMGKHDFEIGFTRWYADYQDPLTYLDMFISTSQMNYGQYSSAEYDALYQQVVGELALDEEARITAMAEMEKIILGDAAILPLYQLSACVLQNPDYNWVKNAVGVVQYEFVSYKN